MRFDRTNFTTDIKDHFDEMEGKTVRLAGRMMSKRIMGKASFADLADRFGRLQMYVKRDELGDEPYKAFKKMDIGDLVGIEGDRIPHPEGRDFGHGFRDDPAVQEPHPAA